MTHCVFVNTECVKWYKKLAVIVQNSVYGSTEPKHLNIITMCKYFLFCSCVTIFPIAEPFFFDDFLNVGKKVSSSEEDIKPIPVHLMELIDKPYASAEEVAKLRNAQCAMACASYLMCLKMCHPICDICHSVTDGCRCDFE